MTRRARIPRRTFLRGAGAALALPCLEAFEALAPARALAAPDEEDRPTRLLFFYVPNGVQLDAWTPADTGPLPDALPPTLAPLAPLRQDVLVLSGLTLDAARAHGDGPGDHARSGAAFLTCAHPLKTGGADLRAGVSVDQVAAERLGAASRLRSLELGCDQSQQGGSCDSGYACAYSSNLSWRTPSMPMPKEVEPRRVLQRLLGDDADRSPEERAARRRERESVLDLVQADARALRARLGGGDRRKLDEYLEALRDLERRVEQAERAPRDLPPGDSVPAGVPADRREHVRLLLDLAVLAFRADVTRVVTFMAANEGSNRSHREVGVAEGHHDLSHHGRDPAKQERVRRIDLFHVELLAHLLAQLKATDDAGRPLLDRCLVVYGSGIGDGDRHNHDELPVLLAGRGGGVAPGRHLRFPRETPLANLYLSLLQRVGLRPSSFADSTGPLAGLS